MSMKSIRATILGGDEKLNYMRCSVSGSYIGNKIVSFIQEQGGFLGLVANNESR